MKKTNQIYSFTPPPPLALMQTGAQIHCLLDESLLNEIYKEHRKNTGYTAYTGGMEGCPFSACLTRRKAIDQTFRDFSGFDVSEDTMSYCVMCYGAESIFLFTSSRNKASL